MKINKKYVILTLIALALVAILFVFFLGGKDETDAIKHVSLIVYGNDASRWENIRLGAEQVCEENGAEITLVNMSSQRGYQEQIDLINREIANGADALLVAACDSNKIGEYFDNSKIDVPVVFVENGVNSKGEMLCVTADDYEMGKKLGEEIISGENPIVKIAIISDETQRESLKLREKGLREVIEPFANDIIIWSRYANESGLTTRKFLQREILEEAVDVVVALDNNTTDALMDALDNLNRHTKVYAISTSDKSVYYLDHQNIKALEYQNEFGIGYIGAQYIFDSKKAHKKYSNNDIEYRVVSKENMYEHENQILLFQFVR